jgi:hypothetical protein
MHSSGMYTYLRYAYLLLGPSHGARRACTFDTQRCDVPVQARAVTALPSAERGRRGHADPREDAGLSPAVSRIRQHTSAYVSIRQHAFPYFSIRQHTSAYVSIRQHTSAYVSISQHTSAYVSIAGAGISRAVSGISRFSYM